jgi:hypothetical protein
MRQIRRKLKGYNVEVEEAFAYVIGFVNQVASLRKMQKEFFELARIKSPTQEALDRKQAVLQQCKALEKIVDEMLSDQGQLF